MQKTSRKMLACIHATIHASGTQGKYLICLLNLKEELRKMQLILREENRNCISRKPNMKSSFPNSNST